VWVVLPASEVVVSRDAFEAEGQKLEQPKGRGFLPVEALGGQCS
jgi:hypothetical protein